MIKLLSDFITNAKAWIFGKTTARIFCYASIAAALLLAWLWADGESVAFVYNEF